MNERLSIFLIVFCLSFKIQAQSSLTSVSQKSNYFISTDSYGLTWISSVDGVNVYNGLGVKVYRPSSYNMTGANVQSLFFEDCDHDMWFSTYNALHHYKRGKDDFEVVQFRDSLGHIIDDSYKVLAYSEPFVILRCGDYLGVFDTNVNRITRSWNLQLAQYQCFDIAISGGKLNVVAGAENKFSVIHINDYIHMTPRQKNVVLQSSKSLNGIQFKADHQIILSYYQQKSIDLYDINTDQIVSFYQDVDPIHYSKYIPESGEILINNERCIKLITLKDLKVKDLWAYPKDMVGKPAPINISNEIIFQGIDGKGIFIFHMNKKKLNHYSLPNGNIPSNVRAIVQSKDGTYWHGSRDQGIGQFDKYGHSLGQYNKINAKCPTNFIMQVKEIANGEIIGLGGNDVVKYDKVHDQFISLYNINANQSSFLGAMIDINDSEFLAVDYSNFHYLHRMTLYPNNRYSKEEIKLIGASSKDEIVQIYKVNRDRLILGINTIDAALVEYNGKEANILKRIRIDGSLNDILCHNDSIYLSTAVGLFIVDKNFNQKPRKITDANDKLNQNIYSTLIHHDQFFLSTNEGLMKYTPTTGYTQTFTKADGIQDLEYNSLASIKDDDGTMIFGGVNGVNIFHPDSIKFLKEPSKIHISKLLINDEPHPSYIHANGVENLNLPYSENTLSFFFNGIDYADMEAIKLKYQLVNYDKHPVALDKNDGLARYANLPPGDYEFNIFATNSDGIWNKEPRIVNITIEPPFWRTWWFRLLVTAAALGSGFSLVRSRYKQRLEKQNQLLREQALMIEKQQGIEAERARIASEMHDDLGSGLTTIRFLSEKALKSVNSESEINEIRKIADQSNALVSNMSEIIWALNSRLDNSEELSAYLRRYVGEYLSEHHMEHHFESEGELSTNILTGEKRRNILLVIKEILHNIVKYSGANGVELHIVFHGEKVNMEITELGGLGFDFDSKIGTGNGLYNIQKRIEKLNGSIKYDRTETGMKISIKIPVENE